jgi:hypothetical protein
MLRCAMYCLDDAYHRTYARHCSHCHVEVLSADLQTRQVGAFVCKAAVSSLPYLINHSGLRGMQR